LAVYVLHGLSALSHAEAAHGIFPSGPFPLAEPSFPLGTDSVLTLPFASARKLQRRARLHGVTPYENSTSSVAALPAARRPLPSWVFIWPFRGFPLGTLCHRSSRSPPRLSHGRRRTYGRGGLSGALPCRDRLVSRETAAPHELLAPRLFTTERFRSSRFPDQRLVLIWVPGPSLR
jgi:hypothetical protein